MSTLVLLAVVGIFSVERTLASQPVWHRAVRWGWALLLTFSVSFNLFAMVQQTSESYVCRSVISAHTNQREQALAELQHALKLQPDNASAQSSLGVVLFQLGQVPEAIGRFEEAVRLEPGFAEAHYNLGTALLRLGRAPEAIQHLERTLRLKPGYVEVYNHLGLALVQAGQLARAIGCYQEALRLEPGYAEARTNLGRALFQVGEGLTARGQWGQAIRPYERSLELKPDDASAHESLGLALSRLGRFGEAVAQFEQALALDRGLASAQNNLAWLLATCAEGAVRNGAKAVGLAEAANRHAGGKDPAILDTLAAAYAEAGRFGEATRAALQAVALVKGAGQTDQAREIESRLKLYQASRPYHEGSTREHQ